MTIDRTSSSKPEEEVLVGIAKGNFNTQKYPHCLKLWLGDNVAGTAKGEKLKKT